MLKPENTRYKVDGWRIGQFPRSRAKWVEQPSPDLRRHGCQHDKPQKQGGGGEPWQTERELNDLAEIAALQ
ncbi:hypothetical protein CR513_36393, partial [Mucuna pruriens]